MRHYDELLDRVLDNTDLVLLDIKQINDEKHIPLTHVSNKYTLEFARYLASRGQTMWIRYVVVPTWSDDDESAEGLGQFIAELGSASRRWSCCPTTNLASTSGTCWEIPTIWSASSPQQGDHGQGPGHPWQVSPQREVLRQEAARQRAASFIAPAFATAPSPTAASGEPLMSEGQVAALLLWLVLLAFSLNASLLRTLGAHPLYQHLCLGGAIVLVPLWTLRAGLHEGLEIHFLGLTSLTLLLGWRLALLAPCLTLLLLAYFGVIPWPTSAGRPSSASPCRWPPAGCCFWGAGPGCLATSSSTCSWRHFSGALSISAKVLASALLMGVSGTYSWHTISADYLSIWPLLLFPEALLNGMTMTLLAVYRPHWVNTFFDREYLGR